METFCEVVLVVALVVALLAPELYRRWVNFSIVRPYEEKIRALQDENESLRGSLRSKDKLNQWLSEKNDLVIVCATALGKTVSALKGDKQSGDARFGELRRELEALLAQILKQHSSYRQEERGSDDAK